MLWLSILLCLATLAVLEVIEISSTQQILQKPYSLIYFSASDCRYCADFNPDFEYISTLYNGNENLQVVKVNGRVHKDLVKLFEVAAFPTLKLYDTTQKKVLTYSDPRTVEDIERFLQDETGAIPQLDNIITVVEEVATPKDVEALSSHGKVLLVFISRQSYDWSTYYYPGHYYQRLSREYPELKFGIVFADEVGTELMEQYHISNMPSAVLLDGPAVKILNTVSTNQMVNYKLTEEMIRKLIVNADIKEENLWFENVDALAQYAASVEFDGHKQRKAGMNFIESRELNLDADEEYELLLSKIGL